MEEAMEQQEHVDKLGRTFKAVRTEEQIRLFVVWTGHCVICGEAFEQFTIENGKPTTVTCPTHRGQRAPAQAARKRTVLERKIHPSVQAPAVGAQEAAIDDGDLL
jgi:hypothetical protein